MIEQRVATLEADVSRIRALLERMEPMITELFHVSARHGEVIKIQNDVAEMKGRFSGFDAKLASLPTTWTMLGIVFTTWALGSGILIFAMNFLRK